jgi:hypothetical protein
VRPPAPPAYLNCAPLPQPVAKTTCHHNDPVPVWNEGFTLVVPPEETMLKVRVMDFDGAGSDELVGMPHSPQWCRADCPAGPGGFLCCAPEAEPPLERDEPGGAPRHIIRPPLSGH